MTVGTAMYSPNKYRNKNVFLQNMSSITQSPNHPIIIYSWAYPHFSPFARSCVLAGTQAKRRKMGSGYPLVVALQKICSANMLAVSSFVSPASISLTIFLYRRCVQRLYGKLPLLSLTRKGIPCGK